MSQSSAAGTLLFLLPLSSPPPPPPLLVLLLLRHLTPLLLPRRRSRRSTPACGAEGPRVPKPPQSGRVSLQWRCWPRRRRRERRWWQRRWRRQRRSKALPLLAPLPLHLPRCCPPAASARLPPGPRSHRWRQTLLPCRAACSRPRRGGSRARRPPSKDPEGRLVLLQGLRLRLRRVLLRRRLCSGPGRAPLPRRPRRNPPHSSSRRRIPAQRRRRTRQRAAAAPPPPRRRKEAERKKNGALSFAVGRRLQPSSSPSSSSPPSLPAWTSSGSQRPPSRGLRTRRAALKALPSRLSTAR